MNLAIVEGTVLREPSERVLATGGRLVAIDLSVTYADRPDENLEVVWIDPPMDVIPKQGATVLVIGHVRRRFFRSGAITVSRTEVVVENLTLTRNTAHVDRLVADASARLISHP